MNARIVRIVQRLSEGAPCTLGDLSTQFMVSERTIRKDIKVLNQVLEKEGIGQVEYGPRGLIVLPADFSEAEKILPVEDTFAYKMSSEERKKLGAAILIGADDYMTLNEIAELFSVSRATILNDLDGIKELVRDAGMEVDSKPSRGVRVSGSESDRRIFLAAFLSKDVPIVDQWYSLTAREGMRAQAITIRKILNECCHAENVTMPDAPFKEVVSLLGVCVQRNKEGHRLETLENQPGGGCSKDDVGNFERTVVRLVGQYCAVAMGADEELFFTERVRAMRLSRFSLFDADDLQVKKIARLFIKRVSKDMGIDLNGDYDLFEFLSNHLESMFTGEPSHFPENPAIDEVLSDQPEALRVVRENLDEIESYAGRSITPVETKYIALHICAALERLKSNGSRLPRVIVVCDGGVGTSQLLAEELRGHFDMKIVKVMPSHDVPYIELYSADLVISTVPLESCPVEQLVIHLPLKDREYGLVHKTLDSLVLHSSSADGDEPELSAGGLLARIEPIIAAEEGEDSPMLNKVRIEVRRYFREAQHLENQLLSPYLHQLLPASHILLDVDCEDWRDAIRKAARPLLDLGYIEARYVSAMISGVEKYGPYDVLAPGFAVPHASPEDGAVKTGMSLVRLKRPVAFAGDEKSPVRFVCVLSAVDAKTHLRAFANLVDMITLPDNAFLDALSGAESEREAASLIETYEYRLVSK